jgi:5-methyltetrahydropteroyltriglutamate--homocysteine methyltransferase
MTNLPPYAVSMVGSWPRPKRLLDAIRRKSPDLGVVEDEAVLAALAAQEEAGLDIVTDGEQRRDNFYSFLCGRVDGLRLMTLAQLLDHVEDKAAFETLLRALDVPAFAIKVAVADGRLRARKSIALDDFLYLRRHTKKPIKVTLPGPYLVTRSAWVKGITDKVHATREALADDVVALLRAEVLALAQAGADVIQIDEPVLTELVFAGKSATRTFMCAALAAAAAPEQELDFAVGLINRVFEGVTGPLTAMHVCRGNWSRDESVLLGGSYDALVPHFARMNVKQFVLEYATPRAGTPAALAALPKDKLLGLGAVNPRTEEIEDVDAVVRRVREFAAVLAPERIHLNPDCGFATFADRPMASDATARAKLDVLVAAAKRLRGSGRGGAKN